MILQRVSVKYLIFLVLFFQGSAFCTVPANEISLSCYNTPEQNLELTEKIRNEINQAEPASFLGFIRVNPKTTPVFYAFIEHLANEIETVVPPYILVSTGAFPEKSESSWYNDLVYPVISIFQDLVLKGNALAWSLVQSFSFINIGSDLIEKMDISRLEKIIAHELAHIKHYHGLKRFIISLLCNYLGDYLSKNYVEPAVKEKILDFVESLEEEPFKHFYYEKKDKEICFPYWREGCPALINYSYDAVSGAKIKSFGGKNQQVECARSLIKASSSIAVDLPLFIIRMWIFRMFERQADFTAATVTKDPKKLADALSAMYDNLRDKHSYIMWLQENIFEKYLWMFSDHPSLLDRVAYLEKFAEEVNQDIV